MRPDETETVFSGSMLRVVVERWGDATREIVERPDSVAVVAIDRDGRLVFVRQRREAARRALLELPAGTVDAAEEPRVAAERELREETGLRGGRWRTGPVFWSTPGFCRERIHLFAADGLEEGGAETDAGEDVEVVRLSAEEVAATVDTFDDGKTIAGVLWYFQVADFL